jgi:SAM-dependent methyltransferase
MPYLYASIFLLNHVVTNQRITAAAITWRSRDFLHYAPFFKSLRRAIAQYGRGEVLDIGCGNKPYAALFSSAVTRYVGVDIEQSHLQKVDIICPATAIPLADNSFDTVLCTQTIEHVYDHQKLLAEAFRLLKPGGYLILSGPFYWPLHEEPHDFFRFTRYGFEELLRSTGFSVQSVEENGGSWSLAGQALVHALCYSKLWPVRFLFNTLRLYILFNLIFGALEAIDHNPISTTNYVVVAQKL